MYRYPAIHRVFDEWVVVRIGLDLDGTLLECRQRQMTLLQVRAKACAVDIDADSFWNLKRNGLSNRAALSNFGVSATASRSICSGWEHSIEDFPWLSFDRLLPGVAEVLMRWREIGNTLHLVSARRNRCNAMQQLHALGLNIFDSVIFVNPLKLGAKIAALSDLRPDIYIGDTERDYDDAIQAGVCPLLVSSGLRAADFLAQHARCHIADDLVALDRFL